MCLETINGPVLSSNFLIQQILAEIFHQLTKLIQASPDTIFLVQNNYTLHM